MKWILALYLTPIIVSYTTLYLSRNIFDIRNLTYGEFLTFFIITLLPVINIAITFSFVAYCLDESNFLNRRPFERKE